MVNVIAIIAIVLVLLSFLVLYCCVAVNNDDRYPQPPKMKQNSLNQDTCVCCGEVVPEGRMVCPNCEKRGE